MPVDFNERLKLISERNKAKKVHKKNGIWPIEKRIEVVGQYLILGNLKLAAATTGVDYDLVRKWKTQPWWPELVAELRATENLKMDTTLSELVELSLHAAYDRIVNGDYIYDQKSGEIRRKPAALRDIHRVAVDLLSKREFLRDRADASGENKTTSVEEHLKILANNMAQWFEKQKHPVIELNEDDVTDVTPIEEDSDALHEKWEEGLQNGEQEVQQPSGEYSEEGGEERGSSGSN